MRILQIQRPPDVRQVMQDIQVDPYGIDIMLPKTFTYLVKINSISNIAANILKQELLSLGADAAVSRDTLTGRKKTTDCLLMANLGQLRRLNEKIKKQPFGLNRLADDLAKHLANYLNDSVQFSACGHNFYFGTRTHVMGILNLTPDSFSHDGFYRQNISQKDALQRAVDHALSLAADGADIIDLGGESSRPGARPVSVKEELARVIPVIKALARKTKTPISIDTYKPEVARQALDNGACIVNDITGLKDKAMRKVIASAKAGAVIMHMKGSPRNMQKNPVYHSLLDEIYEFLEDAIDRSVSSSIDLDKIIIDPGIGIGFGKTAGHNLDILYRLRELKSLGRPLLVGPSRKAFIGKVLNITEPKDRIFGTVSASVLAAQNGADIVRVHDVKEVRQALKLADSINHK